MIQMGSISLVKFGNPISREEGNWFSRLQGKSMFGEQEKASRKTSRGKGRSTYPKEFGNLTSTDFLACRGVTLPIDFFSSKERNLQNSSCTEYSSLLSDVPLGTEEALMGCLMPLQT